MKIQKIKVGSFTVEDLTFTDKEIKEVGLKEAEYLLKTFPKIFIALDEPEKVKEPKTSTKPTKPRGRTKKQSEE